MATTIDRAQLQRMLDEKVALRWRCCRPISSRTPIFPVR